MKGSFPQDWPTADANHKSQVSVLLTEVVSQDSTDHPLGFDSLLEGLRELRATCLLFYYKNDTTQEHPVGRGA